MRQRRAYPPTKCRTSSKARKSCFHNRVGARNRLRETGRDVQLRLRDRSNDSATPAGQSVRAVQTRSCAEHAMLCDTIRAHIKGPGSMMHRVLTTRMMHRNRTTPPTPYSTTAYAASSLPEAAPGTEA
ncbi:unnamed protein product [Prorocentrum cordatum]|uniref:Uncharacterized protein n=1 Tax=Prorocentrum cordatum TaxID=2364126 RepID=A0ABN9QHU0_9DINO|nr:unnamed protein product [Polarella glacialis]